MTINYWFTKKPLIFVKFWKAQVNFWAISFPTRPYLLNSDENWLVYKYFHVLESGKVFWRRKNHFRESRPKKITFVDRDFSKIWFLTKVFSCFRNQLEIWHRKSGWILQTFVQRGYRKGHVKVLFQRTPEKTVCEVIYWR